MNNDVAIFLDLDNLVIGAAEANLAFDIQLILKRIKEITNGRIVLRRAYGDWRQRQSMPKDLAVAGFELQATVRLSNVSKNLADMQMIVDAMETLIDGHDFATYVLATGDRDFVPLVQALRKRGKQVIGIGIRHTSSQSLSSLCDHFIYYEELIRSSSEVEDQEARELLERSVEQLLKDTGRVPASLVKQRMHALSHGVFNHSQIGKRNFRHFLGQHPDLVQVIQEETTLFVGRPLPSHPANQLVKIVDAARHLSAGELAALLRQSLEKLLADQPRARASLLKQTMQELSNGAFGESSQGEKGFRHFLERFPELVAVEQEVTTTYVTRPGTAAAPASAPPAAGQPLAEEVVESVLQQAVGDLLAQQPRVRASLLKQRLQELSRGAFDESLQGDASFRHFLERYPDLVGIQQTGSTLFVTRPQVDEEEGALHQRYRTALKKRGLRVVPSQTRLTVLKDIVALLQGRGDVRWKQLIDSLESHYERQNNAAISKSFINDVLRVARRAEVIEVMSGGNLATAPVRLHLAGSRSFQDAVMRCDATYLGEIQSLADPFDLDEAALALYETTTYARYLKVILHRFGDNGQAAG